MGENVWWGVRLGGGTRGPQKKKMLTFTSFFFFSFFVLSKWDITLYNTTLLQGFGFICNWAY